MTVKALNDYVVLKPIKARDQIGGIYIVNTLTENATVVSAGALCKSKVRPGDVVMIHHTAVPQVITKVGDLGDCWIVPEKVLLAVLNDGENSGS